MSITDEQFDAMRHHIVWFGPTWLAAGRSAIRESGIHLGRAFLTVKIAGYYIELGLR